MREHVKFVLADRTEDARGDVRRVESGLDVFGDYTFPVGTTDFSSFINDAKSKGAQLVAAQMVPPDGIVILVSICSP